MEKEFVPYRESLELKELGFDEISLFCYTTAYEGNPLLHCPHLLLNSQLEGFENEPISAPLYQQAFKWLYQKLDIEKGVMPLHIESQQMLLKELIDKVSSKHLLV